jgi:hypothetical protein
MAGGYHGSDTTRNDGAKKSDKAGGANNGKAGGNAAGGPGGRSASVVGNRFGAPSASAQVAAQKRNAPTNGPLGGMNPQHYGGRRAVNPTQSYEMSLHNMMELSKMMPGPGRALRAGAGALAPGLGFGPDFRGATGMVNGPGDYDGPNRLGLQGRQQQNQLNLAGAFQPPKLPQVAKPIAPMMRPPTMAPGLQMGSGLKGYGAFRPGYSFMGPGR